VADMSELHEGKGLCLKANGVNLVLIRNDGNIFAIENKCPHMGLPLGKGKIENGQITCRFHGARFDIRTGENLDWVASLGSLPLPQWSRGLVALGKQPHPVKTFKVTVESKDVFVDL
jgi:nitrite reductase/ring-hydroxylating ferredoxin subunit